MWGLFAHQNTANNKIGYATNEDFQKVFTEEMKNLYLLSFLLTAHHKKAEQCFVAGLDDCLNGNPVFQEWARIWARRIIVRNAVQMMAPHFGPPASVPGTPHSASAGDLPSMPLEYAPFANVLALEDSERLVYVLSILERYPEEECAALIGVSQHEVREARSHALEHVADFERTTGAPPAYQVRALTY